MAIEYYGYQESTENNGKKVRFIAKVNNITSKFFINIQFENKKRKFPLKKAYTSIIANGETVNPGNGWYFVLLSLQSVPTSVSGSDFQISYEEVS